MRRVRLFHWKSKEAEVLIAKLTRRGLRRCINAETQSPSVRELKESGAVAVVIDLSRLPSHGKYVGAWVRGSKSTRHIPLVFVGGEAEKVAAIKKQMPDAVYSSVTGVGAALKKAIAKPPSDPVVPGQMMETAPGRTAAQKMGIREGSVVGLIDPPADYLKVLGVLPEGVVLEEDSRRVCPVTVWFVHNPGEYEAALPSRRAAGCAQPVVDRVAEGAARRAERELRARGGAGDGAGGLQDLFARRGVERDGVRGEEGAQVGRAKHSLLAGAREMTAPPA